MLKLYKRIKRVLHYHEAWTSGTKVTEHWGKVGERGETVEHKRNKKLSEEEDLEQVLAKSISEGFEPLGDEDQVILLIEYAIDGMGTGKDLKKRQALEARMNETLGWTGLGNCDGGSIGSGTMEVCCFVADFKIAKRIIEEDLKNTKFADYTRIYNERVDPPPSLTQPAEGGMLAPPWIIFQDLERHDERWQKGNPAEYLAIWVAWYQIIPAEARTSYSSIFQEPKGWSDFYESVASSAGP